MTKEEFLKLQLEKTIERYGAERESVFKIRTWCVTVWIGAAALVSSDKVQLGYLEKIILPFLPILFFWLLDGLQFVFIHIHLVSIRRIERIILDNINPSADQLRRCCIGSSVKTTPYLQKFLLYVHCLFGVEQVVVFYGVLLTVTLMLAVI